MPQNPSNANSSNPSTANSSHPYLYKVNTNIHFIDIELDIHVDDYDFYIRAWSQLVEATVFFFASFLTKPTVYKAAKERHNAKRANNFEKTEDDLLEVRDSIISKFFDLLPRVEKIIRESVHKAFKQLLSVESQIKEIMQEEKLIHSFRPLLTCLQLQDLKTINEVTLYSFKKLFKLFHSCFNKQKLYNKLIEYLNNFKDSMKRDSRPLRSSDFFLINSIFILFTKMINNDEVNSIMKIGLEIESSLQNFSVHNFSLKRVLQRVINQQSSSKVINLLKINIQRDEYLNFLLDTLKMDESHPFRERVSREDLS